MNSWRPTAKTLCPDHPWKQWAEHEPAIQETGRAACPAAGAAGARAKTLSWEPVRPELIVELLTITCRAAAFVILRSFEDGVRTKNPADCTYEQFEWFHPRSCFRSSAFLRKHAGNGPSGVSYFAARFDPRTLRHSRVGSSSGSGASAGRSASGTLPQIHSYARPRRGSSPHRIHQHIVQSEMCWPPRDACFSISPDPPERPLCLESSRSPIAASSLAAASRQPWSAKVQRVSLPLPFCGNAGAKARPPGPLLRLHPPVPAVSRANRLPRPFVRADHPVPQIAWEP